MEADKQYLKMKREMFDSTEEWHFYHWTLEAGDIGIITAANYHPWKTQLGNSVVMKVPRPTKRKPNGTRKIHLLRAIQYEPDWAIGIDPKNNKFIDLNIIPLKKTESGHKPYEVNQNGGVLVIDVKGGFTKHQSQKFPVIQKWMFEKYGVFVNRIEPKKFFKKFWVPRMAAFTEKTGKRAAMYEDCIFVDQWRLENHKENHDAKAKTTDINKK